MNDWLIWLYIANAALLINHELDSAYWREWQMMGLPGGIGFFLLIHLPLFGLVLWGLVLLARGQAAGLSYSLALGLIGLIACAVHGAFLLRGREEFRTFPSLALLAAVLVVSAAQLWVTALHII